MNGKRFSDAELHVMHNDLADLKDQFFLHEREEAKKFGEMISAIAENTKSVNRLATNVEPMLDLRRDFQGTIKVGKAVQGLLLWLLKWGVVGAALVGIFEYILNITWKV